MASLVQDVAHVLVELVFELTPVPPSPRRASLDLASCPGQKGPFTIGRGKGRAWGQEVTLDLSVVSLVQDVAPVIVEALRGLTSIPPSLRRACLDLASCLGESAPSQLAEASVATSGATDEGTIVVQGEEHGVDEPPEHYEAAVPDDAPGGVGDEGPSTTQGKESDVIETPEQPEAVAPDEVAEAPVPELLIVETQSGPEESSWASKSCL
ncbi:hypothetical protein AMTR_s00015p00114340 [Amborella trichopoda]|uniref:Uncharacterized protein n=1 Tax=Amborella trichopoda TaxID=13333 RepID=W1PLE1_AMBTC|nr:hypothetical protein AMTR_s00015p00114340 [Amborella trichopoda]